MNSGPVLDIHGGSISTMLHLALSETSSHTYSIHQHNRESSVFEPPTYQITRGVDKALRWEPPADSEELAIALSYHFPFEKTLRSKMQAAMGKFLQAARRSSSSCGKLAESGKQGEDKIPIRLIHDPNRGGLCTGAVEGICLSEGHAAMDNSPSSHREGTNCQQLQSPSSGGTDIPGLISFDAKTLKEVKIKRRKRAYGGAERSEVGANRGKVCEFHRRQKIKCRPSQCPGNRQFGKYQSLQTVTAYQVDDVDERDEAPVILSMTGQSNLTPGDMGQLTVLPGSGSSVVAGPMQNFLYLDMGHEKETTTINESEFYEQLQPNETEDMTPTTASSSPFMGFDQSVSPYDDNPLIFGPNMLDHADQEDLSAWKNENFVFALQTGSLFGDDRSHR